MTINRERSYYLNKKGEDCYLLDIIELPKEQFLHIISHDIGIVYLLFLFSQLKELDNSNVLILNETYKQAEILIKEKKIEDEFDYSEMTYSELIEFQQKAPLKSRA